ncbi:MAG TPA: phosphatase PAP2 family protein [Candidatus Dormibacteraeota bacterium]|nr:phosphatase PAP2 family protein [Candidatus Dormibacteraeota bacterium]
MNRRVLAVSIAVALAAVAVSLYVAGHPFIPEDATVERDVQATAWGPLALIFPFFSWIGDAKGFVLEVVIFIGVLIFNRGTWIVAAASSLSAGWYFLLAHLIIRPRPTTAQVLRVTEHPGASSYPSGHTIFIVTVVAVLMLCFAYRFLPRRAWWAAWIVAALIVAANGIDRIYTGAHWPTDVAGAILIAIAWLTFVVSFRAVSRRIIGSDVAQSGSSTQ